MIEQDAPRPQDPPREGQPPHAERRRPWRTEGLPKGQREEAAAALGRMGAVAGRLPACSSAC